jgi:hypothetical protein
VRYELDWCIYYVEEIQPVKSERVLKDW